MNSHLILLIAVSLLLSLMANGCVRAPGKQPEMAVHAEQYQRRGVNAFKQADYVTAKSMFKNALRDYEKLHDAQGSLRSTINLVECAIQTRSYKDAEQYLRSANNIASHNKFTGFQSRLALLESNLALLTGHTEQALMPLQALLPDFQGAAVSGMPDAIMLSAVANRTRIAFSTETGNPRLWTDRFTSALNASKNKTPALQGRLLRFQAQLAKRNGDPEGAHQLLAKALLKYKAALSQPGISITLLESGKLHMEQHHWVRARHDLQQATSMRIATLDREGTAEGLETLAQLEKLTGNPKAAGALKKWIKKLRSNTTIDWQTLQQSIQKQ